MTQELSKREKDCWEAVRQYYEIASRQSANVDRCCSIGVDTG